MIAGLIAMLGVYLLAAIPFGYLVVRLFAGGDIRGWRSMRRRSK